MLNYNVVKLIFDTDDGGYRVSVVTQDDKYGFHNHAVIITANEKASAESKAKPKTAMQALIKAKAKKLHNEWVTKRSQKPAEKVIKDIIDNFDLGI